jgi:hypothetical protein
MQSVILVHSSDAGHEHNTSPTGTVIQLYSTNWFFRTLAIQLHCVFRTTIPKLPEMEGHFWETQDSMRVVGQKKNYNAFHTRHFVIHSTPSPLATRLTCFLLSSVLYKAYEPELFYMKLEIPQTVTPGLV